ncbi:hypothetical protein [Gymnodinialimonas sp.]
MSPIEPLDTTARLASRAGPYCRRAKALCGDASLTQARAASALDHLAALQNDIAQARLRKTARLREDLRRLEATFKEQEAALTRARAALSEALLRAVPDPANPYGPIRHGVQPDAAINHGPDTTPTPPQATSANRKLLDLDALRPYLSDAAIRQAIERHGKSTGAHNITGVTYATLPASAHLPCAVT